MQRAQLEGAWARGRRSERMSESKSSSENWCVCCERNGFVVCEKPWTCTWKAQMGSINDFQSHLIIKCWSAVLMTVWINFIEQFPMFTLFKENYFMVWRSLNPQIKEIITIIVDNAYRTAAKTFRAVEWNGIEWIV